ncbi:MAG: hypothetical protein ACOC23_09575 [Thermodesulfobacteriota bacterium]
MKTFYTVRDIEDMHAAGVVEIQTHDDVVVTDVAREKAISLGMRLVPLEENEDRRQGRTKRGASADSRTATVGSGTGSFSKPAASPPPSATSPSQTGPGSLDSKLVRKVKAGVIARLGTDKYNHLLDRIIPQVISQFKK